MKIKTLTLFPYNRLFNYDDIINRLNNKMQ